MAVFDAKVSLNFRGFQQAFREPILDGIEEALILDVVEEVAFTREPDLTPGFYEDFEFRIEIAEDAEPGIHRVTIALWANTQYDTSGHMDTFTMEVHVTDKSGGVSGTLLVSVIVIIAILGVAAFLLRRKS